MKRREFLEKAGVGSAALATATATGDAANVKVQRGEREKHDHGHGDDDNVSGPLASATMTFGSWMTDPPLDRFPNLSDRTRNNHHLTPQEVIIEDRRHRGTSSSRGFHHLLVYGPGTSRRTSAWQNPIVRPVLPPLVNDDNERIYRGLDPRFAAHATASGHDHAAPEHPGSGRGGAVSEAWAVSGDVRGHSALLRCSDRRVHHVRLREGAEIEAGRTLRGPVTTGPLALQNQPRLQPAAREAESPR
jgi:hypothetical protein